MLNRLTPLAAILLCLLGSAALLAGAHVFEAAGYEPCPLCLDQREVHWTALGVGAIAALLAWRVPGSWLALAGAGALALVYVWSVGLGAYHAGVEYHFWDGPPCAADTGPINAADILASLDAPTRAVPCDQAAWRMLGVSMAGYNAIISLGLLALAAVAALRIRKPAAAMGATA